MMTITFSNKGKDLDCVLNSQEALAFVGKASEILSRYIANRGFRTTDIYLCKVIKATSIEEIKNFSHFYPSRIEKCVIKGKEYLYYICRGETISTESGKEGRIELAFFKV